MPRRLDRAPESCGLMPAPSPPPALRDRLRRFIQAYWLRPENALWMTLRSAALSDYAFDPPSVDISCGDGVFSFLHAGGVFDPDFDVFTSVQRVGAVRPAAVDMFDCVNDAYRPAILSPAPKGIDVGSDIKATLLAKAQRLEFYGKLVRHDNNEPLPFADETFQTVYCNASYWVSDIPRFLADLGRITHRGGCVLLHVKLDSMRRYSLAACHPGLGDRFLDRIGRDRVEMWPGLAARAVWESRFAAAGLVVEKATPVATQTHAHLWDVGLRPIAPLLVRMTSALSPQTRSTLKREWVDLFCDLLDPFCDPRRDRLTDGDEPAEIQYVLMPR